MKEKAGRVYSVAEENAPVPGCTISREISDGERYIGYFSLAEETDISAEIYDYHKLLIVAGGRLDVYFDGNFTVSSAVSIPGTCNICISTASMRPRKYVRFAHTSGYPLFTIIYNQKTAQTGGFLINLYLFPRSA